MADTAPDETDILCENCGYILNGLQPVGNCPECGSPIDISVSPKFRVPPPWEDDASNRPKWIKWITTSWEVLIHPSRFYRGFNSRGGIKTAEQFALYHWILASVILGSTAYIHCNNEQDFFLHFPIYFLPIFWGLAYFLIRLTIRMAAWLTSMEGKYRGYRVPQPVVHRVFSYHAVHLLPPAFLSFVIVFGYSMVRIRFILWPNVEMYYLYSLCGLVVGSAGYLFITYWIAMRNVFYANR